MANELFGKDRAGIMERLGRLQGSTTFRTQQSGGGTPFSARGLTEEARLILALKMGGNGSTDVGPWLAYSFALLVDDRVPEITRWLANKLIAGTGPTGKRNAHRMLYVAENAYWLALRGVEPDDEVDDRRDFALLVNIGAGWLWTKMEMTIERAERALSHRAAA
ncbi:hypothetical protein ACN9MB_13175 [Dyella kyungheensis]|uniref:hypothetical protein n=1 Tax=Dyella kyungheensis TaxID=1242174 RepID=UPI003CEFF33D